MKPIEAECRYCGKFFYVSCDCKTDTLAMEEKIQKLNAVVEAAKEIASTKSCSCTRELIAALQALEEK